MKGVPTARTKPTLFHYSVAEWALIRKYGSRKISYKRMFHSSIIRQRRDKNLSSLAPAKSVAENIKERLLDVKRDFRTGVVVGAFQETQDFMAKAKNWMIIDSSIRRLKEFPCGGTAICAKEEMLPLEVESADLCISFLTMHRINNLDTHIAQLYHILKKDGFFIGAFFGGDSLMELRESIMEGEVKYASSAGMRVGPFMDLASGVGLIQNAGFSGCIGDRETFTFHYDDLESICNHLRNAGENSLLANRPPTLTTASLNHAKRHYEKHFSSPLGLQATFEVLFLSGWKA